MFLGSYRFDGDPDELLVAYDVMMAGVPAETIIWHACVRDDRGITELGDVHHVQGRPS